MPTLYDEKWKAIKGYEGYYEVSNFGRVKGLDRIVNSSNIKGRIQRGKVLQPIMSNGYRFVNLNKKNKNVKSKISRLVASHFVENLHSKPEVNHMDGNKTNDNAWNLEWCTSSENSQHAHDIKLCKMDGENHPQSRLNNMKVKVIRHLKEINPRLSGARVAKIFQVHPQTIYSVLSGKSWKNI